MKSNTEFIKTLIAEVPDLQSLYDNHLKENNELLPHVFFGDLTRYVVEKIQSRKREDESFVKRILSILEEGLNQGSQEVEELIDVSFVENLSDQEEILVRLKEFGGPKLLQKI